MYSNIIDPETGKGVSITSKLGHQIIKNYFIQVKYINNKKKYKINHKKGGNWLFTYQPDKPDSIILPFTLYSASELNIENKYIPNGIINNIILGSFNYINLYDMEEEKLIDIFSKFKNLQKDKINLIYFSWTSLTGQTNLKWGSRGASILESAYSTNLRAYNINKEISMIWDNYQHKTYTTDFDKIVKNLSGTLKTRNTFNKFGKIFMLDGVIPIKNQKYNIISSIYKHLANKDFLNIKDYNLSTSLSEITLLGTHDSCSSMFYRHQFLNYDERNQWSKNEETDVSTYLFTQSLTIQEQLENNIRVFDIRAMKGPDNTLWACRAMVGFGPKITELFKIISQFLLNNPEEFVLCIIKQDVPFSISWLGKQIRSYITWVDEGEQLDNFKFLNLLNYELQMFLKNNIKKLGNKLLNIWDFSINKSFKMLSELKYQDIIGKCIFLPYEMKNIINRYFI